MSMQSVRYTIASSSAAPRPPTGPAAQPAPAAPSARASSWALGLALIAALGAVTAMAYVGLAVSAPVLAVLTLLGAMFIGVDGLL